MQSHAVKLQWVSHTEHSDDLFLFRPHPLTQEALIVAMSCCNRLLLFTQTVLTACLTNSPAAESM